MGYATIVSGGTAGRYTISLDYGAAERSSLLARINAHIAELTVKLSDAQIKVAEADAREALLLAQIAGYQEEYILVSTSATPENAKPLAQLIQAEMKNLQAMRTAHARVRIVATALKFDMAAAVRRLNYWTDFTPTETREAWCADLTEDAPIGATVATVDIPGESALLLVAPGARGWQPGDGTVRPALKAEQLDSLSARAAKLQADIDDAQAKLDAALAVETALESARLLAQSALAAVNSEDNIRDYNDITAKLTKKRAEIVKLRSKIAMTNMMLLPIQQRIAVWSAKPTSDTPNSGDGVLTARELMSPEQAFFNAAILPGVQKWLPTYRWGTITGIDYDANTADVSLFNAVSSAQSLAINQTATLNRVPVEYMTCNAAPFGIGDKVVVRFIGQDWGSPRVVGFLDNPKPCIKYTLRYFYDGTATAAPVTLEVFKGRDAPRVTAPTPFAYNATLGNVEIFEGWSDGNPALSRQELNVQASATYRARYNVIGSFTVTVNWGFMQRFDQETLYQKWVIVSYPSGITPISGPPVGTYNSGWLPGGQAQAFFLDVVATCAVVSNGYSGTATFSYRETGSGFGIQGKFFLDSISSQYP